MTAAKGRATTGNDAAVRPAAGAGAQGRGERRAGGNGPEGQGTPAGAGAGAAAAAAGREAGASEPAGRGPAGDIVAAVVRQWRTVRPDIDTGPMEVIGRINRCAALLQQAEDAPLRRAGLTRAEFDVLGTLRRTGHELTPGEIVRETFSSGAAVTKRIKQLTERGLVERRGDARDRRVAHVRLTDAGRDLVDGVLPEQLAYESAVLSGLEGGRQCELAALLGELLVQLEGRLGAPRR
ncbi:MarR family winged helix-turn-helix transcriptional regulator [Streptomyces caeni]|uniref:MarR family winged helix-turn-helix transcriptional regulator n=1 Tax=Streptomyces caeni TaxID=2307231 RepID=A0ABW4IK62_9ACTN